MEAFFGGSVPTDERADFPQVLTSSMAMSQFYMWEPVNPRERADFEEDVIASTNENLYVNPLPGKAMKRFAASDDELFFRSPLFDSDLGGEALERSFGERADDFELDLEMSDLLDEFNSPQLDMDIFAEDRDNCAGGYCKKTP